MHWSWGFRASVYCQCWVLGIWRGGICTEITGFLFLILTLVNFAFSRNAYANMCVYIHIYIYFFFYVFFFKRQSLLGTSILGPVRDDVLLLAGLKC